MKDTVNLPFGKLDASKTDELKQLERLLDEKYKQTVEDKEKKDKAS